MNAFDAGFNGDEEKTYEAERDSLPAGGGFVISTLIGIAIWLLLAMITVSAWHWLRQS